MGDSPRQVLGTFFRAVIDFVEKRGLMAQLREKVSPQTQALIDKPPRPLSFISSEPIDEVQAALGTLAGPEVLRECGLASARPLGWSLLQPMLRMAFQMFGQSPGHIFGNLDMFFSLVVRGISFSFARKKGEKGGTVITRFEGADTPEAAFHLLRGSLEFVFEASGTTGTVGAPEVVESTPAAALVHYRVSWA